MYHILSCIMHIHGFYAHYTWDYYTYYYTHGMYLLYPCIIYILIIPSKIWAKKVHIIHGKIW